MLAKAVFQACRPPFLILTFCCVFLGVALAAPAVGSIPVNKVIMITLAALFGHISVNTFNEYFDFKSGLDALTQKTPFSGGSGALIAQPQAANVVLLAAIATLLLSISLGLYLALPFIHILLPIGIAGVLLVITYTQWLNRNTILCLISPGIGFGLIMTLGSYIAITGTFTLAAFFVCLIPFFLVNNLLLLNQFPDVEADKKVGRNHLPIQFGFYASSMVYALFWLMATGILITCTILDYLPYLSLIALIALLPGIWVIRGAFLFEHNQKGLEPYMAINVAITLLTPGLIGAGIFLT